MGTQPSHETVLSIIEQLTPRERTTLREIGLRPLWLPGSVAAPALISAGLLQPAGSDDASWCRDSASVTMLGRVVQDELRRQRAAGGAW